MCRHGPGEVGKERTEKLKSPATQVQVVALPFPGLGTVDRSGTHGHNAAWSGSQSRNAPTLQPQSDFRHTVTVQGELSPLYR